MTTTTISALPVATGYNTPSKLPEQDHIDLKWPATHKPNVPFTKSAYPSSTTSLADLPDSLIRKIWQGGDNSDRPPIRQLPLVSNSVFHSIKRASSTDFKYHSASPFTSILGCIDREDSDCLAYWLPRLSNIPPNQIFALIIKIRHNSAWFQEHGFSDLGLSSVRETLYSFADDVMQASLASMDLFDAFLIKDIAPSSIGLENQLDQVSKNALTLIDQEVHGWERATKSNPTLVNVERVDSLSASYLELRTLINQDDSQLRGLEFSAQVQMFYHRDMATIGMRHHAYRGYVRFLEKSMATIPDLNNFSGYPSPLFPGTSKSMSRIMDQALFPQITLRLLQAAVVRRRVDILQTLIAEEGALFFIRTCKLPGECQTFIKFLLTELLRSARSRPRGDPRSPDQSNAEQSVHMRLIQLVLENGPRMIYPSFLKDIVELGSMAILRYVVNDLGISLGWAEAVQAAHTKGESDMVAILMTLRTNPSSDDDDDEFLPKPRKSEDSLASISGTDLHSELPSFYPSPSTPLPSLYGSQDALDLRLVLGDHFVEVD